MSYERQVTRLAILTGLPGVVLSLYLLWEGGAPARLLWTVGLILTGTWFITTMMLRERVIRPLQTLSNMLAALREGDYSIRARSADRDDALGLALLESNLLGETLRAQRLGAMEATALLRTVMAEIDVAIFAFDDGGRLRTSIARASDCLRNQRSVCSGAPRPRSDWRHSSKEIRRAPPTRCSPEPAAGGKSAAAVFARMVDRTSCW